MERTRNIVLEEDNDFYSGFGRMEAWSENMETFYFIIKPFIKEKKYYQKVILTFCKKILNFHLEN